MKILKRGLQVSHAPEPRAPLPVALVVAKPPRLLRPPVVAPLLPAESSGEHTEATTWVDQHVVGGDQLYGKPLDPPASASPPRAAEPPAAPLAVMTPALRLQQRDSAWERVQRIDQYRLARGLKLRLRVVVTVCDSERKGYASWPGATGTVEVGEAGQPGIENGKDMVWAVDELIEAVGRVGPERVARVLRELRVTPSVQPSPVPVIPLAEDMEHVG